MVEYVTVLEASPISYVLSRMFCEWVSGDRLKYAVVKVSQNYYGLIIDFGRKGVRPIEVYFTVESDEEVDSAVSLALSHARAVLEKATATLGEEFDTEVLVSMLADALRLAGALRTVEERGEEGGAEEGKLVEV